MKDERSKSVKPKIFGAGPLHVREDSGRLVGGIVEKGFSENKKVGPLRPFDAPWPTVVPFPVARHRSDGPHWAPKVGSFEGHNNDYDVVDDECGREEDVYGMELAADTANPVERKEKKSLDFSRWHEIIKNYRSHSLHENGKDVNLIGSTICNQVNDIYPDNLGKPISNSEVAKQRGTSYDTSARKHSTVLEDKASVLIGRHEGIDGKHEMTTGDESQLRERVTREHFVQQTQQAQNEVSHSESLKVNSLESQIDAENHARLAKMSAKEIAEAQAEIMKKLNPELIKALKRRGQEKANNLESSLPIVAAGDETASMQHAENLSKVTVNSGYNISPKPVNEVSVGMETENEKKKSPNKGKKGGLWNDWSQRVEHVRNLRFSLDGNIVDDDVTEASNTGDTFSERDFLRTEGDPGAAGYTIKEAISLTRSVFPGQRTLALQLITCVLDRSIRGVCQNEVGSPSSSANTHGSADWKAIWAFSLGPEPELSLSLRMSLDDNHNSVVLACAKAIQCALSYDMNEIIFDISENASNHPKNVFTAPLFRGKPDINSGFLPGGFWKYNTKSSNIDLTGEELSDQPEGERTIQDDIVVAGQDIAAGFVRMGILPRICYLIEANPSPPLEECLISILIAIARHSPTCANAVMKCERLVRTVANRFSLNEHREINACKIKSVKLIKALACSEKKSCLTFIKNGIFRQVTWHLYRTPFSFDQWVLSGTEACKYSAALLVEQLRLWKVCINYGYCISDFYGIFTSVCMWLSVPKMELLIVNDVMNDYLAVTKEVYLLFNVLASKLPNFYSVMDEKMESTAQDRDSSTWSRFGSIIDVALEWIEVKSIPFISRFFGCQIKGGRFHRFQDSELNSLLWVISSVVNMLSSLLKAVIPQSTSTYPGEKLPWIPDFITRIGLEIIKYGYIGFSGESNTFCIHHPPENCSVMEYLFQLRLKSKEETAISSSCCIQGLIRLANCVDKLIQHSNLVSHNVANKSYLSREDTVLANGILISSVEEVRGMQAALMRLITNEWQCMQLIEIFGRGGPAPGGGVGWGASCGGYWSLKTLMALQDARLFMTLLEISEITTPYRDPNDADVMNSCMHMLNCSLSACLIMGPGNSSAVDKLLNFIFQVSVLKNLNFCIDQFLYQMKGLNPFGWNYEEEEFQRFSEVLTLHFRDRWLTGKKKSKSIPENNYAHNKISNTEKLLDTIHEDMDNSYAASEETSSMMVEWAYQRLPLPVHWFLSAISTINVERNVLSSNPSHNFHEVIKGGLFFLLGIEAIPTFLSPETCSPVKWIPVVWKLHALSAALVSGMSVLEDEKSRDIYEALQNIYAEFLNEKKVSNSSDNLIEESLKFESDIHENYGNFVELLVEQFSADSYGDVVFGRQVALYLLRSVEAPVRLATWNALSNARAFELLPPLDQCLTKIEGYLEPIEDNEMILEAYVKSWVSGALVKAASRVSMTFSLVLHHLSCFIFGICADDMLPLRNKLVKNLIRDSVLKQLHEVMVVKLIQYKKPNTDRSVVDTPLGLSEVEGRFQLLQEICKGNSSLMYSLEKLRRISY